MEKEYMTLKEIAVEMKLNKSTLHYYISKGLITHKWDAAGVYFFKKDIVSRVEKIRELQKGGLRLNEIKGKL